MTEQEITEQFENLLILQDFEGARNLINIANEKGFEVYKMRNMYFNVVDSVNEVIF